MLPSISATPGRQLSPFETPPSDHVVCDPDGKADSTVGSSGRTRPGCVEYSGMKQSYPKAARRATGVACEPPNGPIFHTGKQATACSVGQTFLSAISAAFFAADRNACPTVVRNAGWRDQRRQTDESWAARHPRQARRLHHNSSAAAIYVPGWNISIDSDTRLPFRSSRWEWNGPSSGFQFAVIAAVSVLFAVSLTCNFAAAPCARSMTQM